MVVVVVEAAAFVVIVALVVVTVAVALAMLAATPVMLSNSSWYVFYTTAQNNNTDTHIRATRENNSSILYNSAIRAVQVHRRLGPLRPGPNNQRGRFAQEHSQGTLFFGAHLSSAKHLFRSSYPSLGSFTSQDFDIFLHIISCGSFAENCGDLRRPV